MSGVVEGPQDWSDMSLEFVNPPSRGPLNVYPLLVASCRQSDKYIDGSKGMVAGVKESHVVHEQGYGCIDWARLSRNW